METILRGLVIYLIVWLLMRITGKRSLAQVTIFDFVLLLMIGEATQQALLGNDFSVTNAFLAILTLIGIDIVVTRAGQRWPAFDKFTNDVPLVLIENGRPIDDRLEKSRVNEDDVLAQARMQQAWREWTRSSTRCSNATVASPSYLVRRSKPPRIM